MQREELTKAYPRTAPTIRFEDSPSPRAIQEHPSYAIASITHPSGGRMEMFGSDIPHDQRVGLRIDLAYEETAYGVPEYRTQPRSRVLEIEMTSFQWAGLVASHSGRGVPCTLRYLKGEPTIPLIQGQTSSEEMAKHDVRSSLEDLVKDFKLGLAELGALQSKGKANKGELTAVYSKLARLSGRLPETTAFALTTFEENAEVIVAKAQAEVEATINNMIVRTGIKALGGNETLLLGGPQDE